MVTAGTSGRGIAARPEVAGAAVVTVSPQALWVVGIGTVHQKCFSLLPKGWISQASSQSGVAGGD